LVERRIPNPKAAGSIPATPAKLNIMAKVRVIASTVRYGSNGFKHAGDEYNLPDAEAKEKAANKLVVIIPDVKEDKDIKLTKEDKETIKTK
jgi:hypothetical protein